MLVIADVERPLVIAGVFGSVDAEIDEHTTDIVLEAANFAGPSILRTELHTGIRSEASNRFEKGIDPEPGAGRRSTSPTGCSPSSAAAPSRPAWSTPAACRRRRRR